MKSYVTSYNALFTRQRSDAPVVERVEIPLIQRDYAQGRDGPTVERIRANFLDVLHAAVTGGDPVGLDFVFGDVEGGTLRPLDGQQRLTTLFLLHWYLAFRAERIDQEQGWKRFSYATRPSARLFCERLANCKPPLSAGRVTEWIVDQPWYLHTWLHDPSIQSMLVMLDAIHERFAANDCLAAWNRLIDAESPAISFHLLPIEQMGLSEDLYVKMNSRGKPLTAFENFKARFEQVLESSCPQRVEEFALKVDGAWADVFWRYHGGDFIVDDEFLRYFHFVTEVCVWHEGWLASGDLLTLAERIYGPANADAAKHLDFLFRCLDTWAGVDVAATFESLFTLTPSPWGSDDTGKVVLFGLPGRVTVDLFSACCESYGQIRDRNRAFNLPQTIFLYAVIVHRLHETPEFPRRLRILRNLVEASGSELRAEKMPGLLADVRRLVVEGLVEGISSFNQAQLSEERSKAECLARMPGLESALFHLEDHPVLRGCVGAFELDVDAAVFEGRARAFNGVFADARRLPSLTGALLATGDYSRPLDRRFHQLGSGTSQAPWRELLAGTGRANLANTRAVLLRFLDAVAESTGEIGSTLDTITARWLAETAPDRGLDWRWYFVKYSAMREGRSGRYAVPDGAMGYRVCMLDKHAMHSYYRDPFLTAIHRESGVGDAVGKLLFTGYETAPRWMTLKSSGVELQCVDDGLMVKPPQVTTHVEAFERICREHGVRDGLLAPTQVDVDGRMLDTRDRVQLGASLVRNLVSAGL